MKKLLFIIPLFILTTGCASKLWQKPLPPAPAITLQEQAEEETQQEPQTVVEEAQLPKPAEPVKTTTPEKPKTPAPAAPTAISEVKEPTPAPPPLELGKEAPLDRADKNVMFTSDGRLMHPWYAAPEIKDFEGPKPNWFGETLKFKVGWSMITAGEAELSTGKMAQTTAGPAFVIESFAQSYSVIDKLFKVRDINISWVAADLSKSLGYWQSVREGSYKRDEWVIFDYINNLFTIHKQNNRGALLKIPVAFTGEIMWDMLSSLYFVRTQPLPLKGEIFFDIVNSNDQYPLKVIVHGKETVKVKAGKFNCILVEPLISGEGIFVSKGKSLKVWLTDDEYRMPVKMTVEVFIGSVYAELTEYKRSK